MSFTVFLGNLPPWVTADDIKGWLTADDLVFTAQVGQDRELAVFNHVGYAFLDRVTPVDQRTVTVRWKQPYIQADAAFSYDLALPMPRHLVERTYADDKQAFADLPVRRGGIRELGKDRRIALLREHAHRSRKRDGRPKGFAPRERV